VTAAIATGPAWTLYHRDSLVTGGLDQLAASSVHHVITDPPYSPWVHLQHKVSGGARTDGSARYKDLGFEALDPADRAVACVQFARLSLGWVLICSDAEGITGWIVDVEAAGLEHIRVGAFVKEGATPQFSGDRPAPGWEAIEIAHPPGKKRWNGGGRHAVWRASVEGGTRFHPTQKPLSLMEALVRDFTQPGDTILDPYAGSGTTGVACVRLGRRFIGYERDPKHFATAVRRLQAAREQTYLTTLDTFRAAASGKRKQMGMELDGPPMVPKNRNCGCGVVGPHQKSCALKTDPPFAEGEEATDAAMPKLSSGSDVPSD
jgi:site-specific DNA-methyltransferase (adenine-specific)